MHGLEGRRQQGEKKLRRICGCGCEFALKQRRKELAGRYNDLARRLNEFLYLYFSGFEDSAGSTIKDLSSV